MEEITLYGNLGASYSNFMTYGNWGDTVTITNEGDLNYEYRHIPFPDNKDIHNIDLVNFLDSFAENYIKKKRQKEVENHMQKKEELKNLLIELGVINKDF